MMKNKFMNWSNLFKNYLKRDLKKIIIWVLSLGLFSSALMPAFVEMAQGQALIGLFETMANPAMIAMVGPTPIESAEYYTLGAMYAHEMLLMCCLFAMVVSTMHIISHTRKEEDLGMSELIRSFQVGRQANSLAIMLEVILINLAIAMLTFSVLLAFDDPSLTIEGSLLFSISIGTSGIFGALIALCCAQIMPNGSSATMSSLAIIGLLYLLRATTDVIDQGLSLFNPMAWFYFTFPYTENNWYLLSFALILGIILLIIAFVLEEKRDVGAGYLKEKEGRAYAKKSLLSVTGLFLTLNKLALIAWLITFSLIGGAYGAMYGDMQSFIEGNDLMEQMFAQSGITIEDSFTSLIVMVMASLVAILPIVVMNRLFSEESKIRLSQIFSTKVSRTKLYWTSVIIASVSGIIGLLLASASLGYTGIYTMNDKTTLSITTFLEAGANFIPLIIFITGLTALFIGWQPKLSKIAYGYLAYTTLMAYFINMIEIPDILQKTSINNIIPLLPIAKFDLTTFIVITGIGLIMMVIGHFGYKKRDLIENG